jgi:AraC-like DNA-binding protein
MIPCVSFLTRPPSSRLAGLVERLWRVEEEESSSEPETICPDGRPEIVVHLGDPMRGQSRYLLVGQMDAPLTIVSSGRVAMVGARLSPTGLYRLLPVAQDDLIGEVVSLESVWTAWTRRTADRVASALTPAGQLDVFAVALEELVTDQSANRADCGVEAALDVLRRSGGNASITWLAGQAGISRRQFERRFREQVGLSPRVFGRIVRFQRAFRALGMESGAAIAARCGYADQAHLVREMRRFGGQAPSALAAADGLTAFFRQ